MDQTVMHAIGSLTDDFITTQADSLIKALNTLSESYNLTAPMDRLQASMLSHQLAEKIGVGWADAAELLSAIHVQHPDLTLAQVYRAVSTYVRDVEARP